MKKLKKLLEGTDTLEEKQKLAAVLLYRINKAIKYVQLDKNGLSFKFYHLKGLYCNYFAKNGFLIKSKAEEKMVLTFSVQDVILKFHQVKPKRNRFSTTVDISNKTEEVKQYIIDIEIMYKLLLKIAESLEIK